MTELQWNLGWTLATLGVCWVALSCLVALALGQIIRRGKASTADHIESATPIAGVDVPDEQFDLLDLEYGSRAASGTRLKAIRLEQEPAEPARKVS